jgi:DNA mismatch endonuclease (patch repair protein)
MSRIRGKDTTPEKIVRSLLHRMGYRFRLHRRIPIEVGLAVLSGPSSLRSRRGAVRTPRPTFARPDILLPKHKTAIFVHGCFWHRHRGCKNCTTPTNRANGGWRNSTATPRATNSIRPRSGNSAGA